MKRVYRRGVAASLVVALFAFGTANAQITNVVIESTSSSAQSDVPFTFGQVFKPGAVASGSTVVLRQGSTAVPTQLDVKTRYSDGSVQHGVISGRVPSLSGNGSAALTINSTGGSSGGGIGVSTLLATAFNASVSLNVGGTTYSASARDLLGSTTPTQWLSGPVVSEWVVKGPVKTSGGQAHPHLAAQFAVRAYGNPIDAVRVDVVIENGYTFVGSPSSFGYSSTITVGSQSVDSRSVTHANHTRWHKRFWWNRTPSAYARIDTGYLQDTKFVPKYVNATPSSGYLSGLTQSVEPMQNGDQSDNMPNTGAQSGIGPLPRWTSVFLLSGDRRAFNNMLANDDGASAYSIHYRDEGTGYPVSVVDHPNSSISYPNDISTGSGGSQFTHDKAHQPSQGFVSYLVTGDVFYMEEMQFWSSFNMISTHSQYRQGASGLVVGRGQMREQAWMLRNLAQSARATPDGHPLKSKFMSNLNANIAKFNSEYVNNSGANKLGAIDPYEGIHEMRSWEDDFFTWTAVHLVELGFESARDMALWKSKYPVGRMGNTDYCYINATPYTMAVGVQNGAWYTTFRQVYEANWGSVPSCPDGQAMGGYPSEPTGYPSNLRPALAGAASIGAPGAAAAWARFAASRPTPNYADYPNWGVMPRALGPAPNPPTNVTVE
jgi:hypothetical protein